MHKLLGSLTGVALIVATLPAWAQAPAAAPGAPAAAPAPAPGAAPAAAPSTPAEVAPPTNPEALPLAAPPAAAAPPPPAPLPEAPPPAAPATPAAPPPAGPDKLAVGKALQGIFQPSLLLQFWGYYANNPNNKAPVDVGSSTFRVRRAEIRVKGDIIPGLLSYNVMFDPAKAFTFGSKSLPVAGEMPPPTTAGNVTALQPTYTDPSVLQDYFITFKSDYVDVSLGQFKIPVSYEGFNGASKIIFPERALVARQYGDKRELGIKAEKKIGDYFFYSLGIFNGSGPNTTDTDNEKDVGLRLEAYPIKGLTVAGMGYTTIGDRDGTNRDRLEADLKYDANDILVLGEYIHAWDGPSAKKVEGHGYYATFGYTFMKRLQPIARFGMLNTDKSISGDRIAHYEGGLNYYLQALEARISLSVSAYDQQDKPATATAAAVEVKTRWDSILAFQAGF